MLSLTRIEEGQLALEKQPVELHHLCHDLRDMAEALAEMNEQTLLLNLGREFSVQADKHLLFQALFNLVLIMRLNTLGRMLRLKFVNMQIALKLSTMALVFQTNTKKKYLIA